MVEQLLATGGPVQVGDFIAVVKPQKEAIEIEVPEDTGSVLFGSKAPFGISVAEICASDVPDAPQPKDPPADTPPKELPEPSQPDLPPVPPLEEPVPPPERPPQAPPELDTVQTR